MPKIKIVGLPKARTGLGGTCGAGKQWDSFLNRCVPIAYLGIPPAGSKLNLTTSDQSNLTGFKKAPLSDIGKTGAGEYKFPSLSDISKLKEQQTEQTNNDPYGRLNKTLAGLNMLNQSISTGLSMGADAANRFRQEKQDRDYRKKQRDMAFNTYTPLSSSDRFGDYTTNEGFFRIRDTGFKTKGAYDSLLYPSLPMADVGGVFEGDVRVNQDFIPMAFPDLPGQQMQQPQTNAQPAVGNEKVVNHNFGPKGRKYNRSTVINPSEITMVDGSQMDVDKVLDTLAANEKSQTGKQTQLVGPQGQRASAMGKWGITKGTRAGIYNRYFKDQMSRSDFESRYLTDPSFERAVAGSLVKEMLPKYGSLVFGAWYYPEYAENFMKGDQSVLNRVPREDYGNKITWGGYLKKAQDKYFSMEEGGTIQENQNNLNKMRIQITDVPDNKFQGGGENPYLEAGKTLGKAAVQAFDPTGITSWPDAYNSIREAWKNPTALNVLGAVGNSLSALPVVGTPFKGVKAGINTYKAATKLGRIMQPIARTTGKILDSKILNPVRTMDAYNPLAKTVGATTEKFLGTRPGGFSSKFISGANQEGRFFNTAGTLATGAVNAGDRYFGYNQNQKSWEYGGESNTGKRKIQIIGTPSDEELEMAYGGQPQYSGQSDYGLYVGQRNLYKTMAKNPYDNVNNTVSEEKNPDSTYVLEAEGGGKNKVGETILRPDGTHDGIVGERHSNGGVKLTEKQAPEGSFIFSDTAKMKIKDPSILKEFGLTDKKGGYTPAEIAKRYDLNKFRAILEDPYADKLSKKTAELKINDFEQKLGKLALIQESMKGFPQGLPDAAKPFVESSEEAMEKYGELFSNKAQYGGQSSFKKYQDAGQVKNNITVWPGDVYENKENKSRYTPQQIAERAKELGYTGDLTTPGVMEWVYNTLPGGKDVVDELHKKHAGNKGGVFNEDPITHRNTYKWGYRWDTVLDRLLEQKKKAQPPVTPTSTTTSTNTGETKNPEVKEDKGASAETPEVNPFVQNPIPPMYGWSQQDINNLGTAYRNAALIKKYQGFSPNVSPYLPNPAFEDWQAAAQKIQTDQYLKPAETLAAYTSPTALASNLSNLAGQAAENVAGTIAQTGNRNVQIANAAEAQRADVINKFNVRNIENMAKLYDESNIYDDKYREALRKSNVGITKAYNQGLTNAANMYNLNLTSPYFKTNPYTGLVGFDPRGGYAAFLASQQGSNQGTGEKFTKAFKDIYDRLSYLEDDKERISLAKQYAANLVFGKSFGAASETKESKDQQLPQIPVSNPQEP